MMLFDEARLTSDAMRYGYAVGKVRVLEARVLDRSAFERLLDAQSFEEQKRLLSETAYGRYLEGVETAEDVERALDVALDDFYGFLGEAALPEAITHYFTLRYDFTNLKAAAKARALGIPVADLLVKHGEVPLEAFSAELTQLPDPLGTTASTLPAIDAVEGDGAGEVEAEEISLMEIDTAVDQAMFAELRATAERAKSGYLVDIAARAADLANVKTLVRARLAGVPAADVPALLVGGGHVPLAKLEPLAGLEIDELAVALAKIPALKGLAADMLADPGTLDLAVDAVNAAALHGARGGQIGPEPVIGYVFEREAEVGAVRVLLLGRLAGIDNETLRARVRAMQ